MSNTRFSLYLLLDVLGSDLQSPTTRGLSTPQTRPSSSAGASGVTRATVVGRGTGG